MAEKPEPLITKKELCAAIGRSEEFVDNLPLPTYPVGKRDYFLLSDYEPTLQRIRKEAAWQNGAKNSRKTSNGSKGRRTSGTNSGTKVIVFEEALRRTT